MIKKRVAIIQLCWIWAAAASANEGMWCPWQVPEIAGELKSLGVEMDPSRLSDLTGDTVGAVVKLGGCTASFVSPEGLLITNYHCAYNSVQRHSTVERNLVEEGFVAGARGEELAAAPGTIVRITVDYQDVTEKVVGGLDGVYGKERYTAIDQRQKALIKSCEDGGAYRCRLASFYGGLTYSLLRQLELRDVRLVYTPPSGIGQFGGELDNFAWPRQTGDFAFFRAYVGPDRRPAEPSPENVPYHPEHYLKIAREPLAEGDLIMVVGYPGGTNRYRLAAEVEDKFGWSYPRVIESYESWLRVIEDAVRGDEAATLKYGGWIGGLNNTLKFAHGMVDSPATPELLEQKRRLEGELAAWIAQEPQRQADYGGTLEALRHELAEERENREPELRYHLATRSSLLGAARELYELAVEKEKPDLERSSYYQERNWGDIRRGLVRIDSRFDPKVDRAVWRFFLLQYHELPAGQRRADLDGWFDLEPGQEAEAKVDRALARLYGETRLGDQDYRLSLMEASAAAIEASEDPFLQLAVRLREGDQQVKERSRSQAGTRQALQADYMRVLVAFLKSRGQITYPDANGTLRISYGTVDGCTTADGIRRPSFTTAGNILAKDTGAEPYATPPNALRRLQEKRFGPYRDPRLDSLPVNFMATADVTGGHSGSPTLNRRGELVGLLFDTNYESIISDWGYIPSVSRSVHVDIRFILWTLDEFNHAEGLLDELGVRASAAAVVEQTPSAGPPFVGPPAAEPPAEAAHTANQW